MWKRIRDEKGNIAVFAALLMLCVVGVAALSIDVGSVVSARNQLQAAADASVLSGAMGLLDSQNDCIAQAMATAGRNLCLRQPVSLSIGDISFPQPDQVMVQTSRSVPMNFASVLGVPAASITVTAVAEIGTITGTKGLKPWGIPDVNYNPGDVVCIKAGSIGMPSTPNSYFYPVDFPPLNRGVPEPGAAVYRENIIRGSDYVAVGDIIQVEPGNMVGPTKQGVDNLISRDAGAYWDPDVGVVNSSHGPDGTSASPRVIIIPMYDKDDPPNSGRSTITVSRLGGFFVTGFVGKDLYGVFMEIVDHGTFGGGSSMIKGVRLIQ
ncbi:Tad domain-containing protein [bacterium]|nr:Tad domain-containing protein [bacterium]